MDCDQVFVALTAAPFPTGAPSDRQVEQHLAVCAECSRLARALRPCGADAPESLPARERRLLPSYRPAGTLVTSGNGKPAGSASLFPGLPSDSAEAIYRPAMRSQVAAFTLVRHPLRNPLRDALLLAVVLAVFAVGCWGIGIFAL